MLYLLALVGVLALAVVLWRVLNAERTDVTTTRRGTIAPDDDPEFLRKLGEHKPKDNPES